MYNQEVTKQNRLVRFLELDILHAIEIKKLAREHKLAKFQLSKRK